ncbi:MAG: hypothetical protein J6Q51_04840 [Clostridia bacterium]|nr:hypothetical protein [Clostridia bacterium]
MKYTKLSGKIADFVLKSLYAILMLFIIGLTGVFVWLDLYQSLTFFSIIWIAWLPTAGLGINWFLSHILGDEFYNTGMVVDGSSIYDVVKTPKYYTRRMYVCFIECFLFALLIVRFAFLFPVSVVLPIIGIVASIVAIVIYFIVGMSSYEQSSIKRK